ncbi:MAG: hypothetical protein KAH06_05620 [Desulfobacterales bacterium]|nr:hypothetical protein [Desulfobacterales bacterium]
MVSRVWVINSVLAIALVICLINIRDVWHTGTQVFPEKESAVKRKKSMQIKKFPENVLLKASDYQNVVEKNLFSPDRVPASPEIEADEPEIREEVRISGKKVVLYGVIMIDNYKKALTNNPADRTSDLRWVREGEQIGNLKVRQILEDNILLADEEGSYRVLLYDPEKVSKMSAKSVRQNDKNTQPQVIMAGKKNIIAKNIIAKKKINKQDNHAKKVTTSTDDEYEIIDTPFGEIKRKRR